MKTFQQFIERKDLPDLPEHPGIKPLDWKDVGKTEIKEDDAETEITTKIPNMIRHKGEHWYHTGKTDGNKHQYASYHPTTGKPTGKRMWRTLK